MAHVEYPCLPIPPLGFFHSMDTSARSALADRTRSLRLNVVPDPMFNFLPEIHVTYGVLRMVLRTYLPVNTTLSGTPYLSLKLHPRCQFTSPLLKIFPSIAPTLFVPVQLILAVVRRCTRIHQSRKVVSW